MWDSATSSDRSQRAGWRAHTLLWLALLALTAPGSAQDLSREEALRLAFPPDSRVERQTAYLEPAQLAAARALAGSDAEVTQRVVSYYVAKRAGRPAAVAYFDSHRVRTLNEVLMVVVDTLHRVQRVEVLRFAEPPEYRPPEKWLARFEGGLLSPALSLRRNVVNLTGATLTAVAATRAIRRVLALHRVIRPFEVQP